MEDDKAVVETERIAKSAYYDFARERVPLQVLGGYTVLQRPFPARLLSGLFFLAMQSLFVVTTLLAVVTVCMTYEQKAVLGQALFTIGTLGGGLGVTLVRYLVSTNLEEAVTIIRRGIYIYKEYIDEEYVDIKRKRVRNIRLIIAFTSWMFLSCGFVYISIFPTLKIFLFKIDTQNSVVNPFLPIPLFIPFDTNSTLGFGLIYFLNGLTLICMYASFASHLQIYVSLSELLTAELEVLEYSIQNITRRAYMELKCSESVPSNLQYERLFDDPHYQRSLFYCLRKNIIHHQAIISFKKVMAIYLEGTNTVGILLFSLLMATCIITLLEDPKRNLILSMALGATALGYLPMCIIGEVITNTSARIAEALFSTPWPDCDEKFKVLLKIAITNTIKPIVLKATIIHVNISLETFGELVSGGYKLVNVLR